MTMLLALAAIIAPQADPLAPLAFLAGHCWRAERVDQGFENWHCFERTADGGIHGFQEGRRGDERIRASETDYRWDPAARVIRYRVVFADPGETGEVIEGVVTVNGNVFDMGKLTARGRSYGWSMVRIENGFQSRIDPFDGNGPRITNTLIRAD